MQVWDEAGSGCLRWDAKDVGAEVMGAVVENSVIQSACMRVAQEAATLRGSVDFMWPAVVKGEMTTIEAPRPLHRVLLPAILFSELY